jgi:hypothetical protein
MTYQGHIEKGTIILDKGPQYPDGTAVVVALTVVSPPTSPEEKEMGTLYDRWQSFIGIAEGLPEDLAANHDYYAHGRPKQ